MSVDTVEMRDSLGRLADLIQDDIDDAIRVVDNRRHATLESLHDLLVDVEFNKGRMDVLTWALHSLPVLEQPERLLARAVLRYETTGPRHRSDLVRARRNGEREGLRDLAKAIAPEQP